MMLSFGCVVDDLIITPREKKTRGKTKLFSGVVFGQKKAPHEAGQRWAGNSETRRSVSTIS
jgi:hypothetical protein